jgi:hypothetical protein
MYGVSILTIVVTEQNKDIVLEKFEICKSIHKMNHWNARREDCKDATNLTHVLYEHLTDLDIYLLQMQICCSWN